MSCNRQQQQRSGLRIVKKGKKRKIKKRKIKKEKKCGLAGRTRSMAQNKQTKKVELKTGSTSNRKRAIA